MFKRRRKNFILCVSCGLLFVVADAQADQDTASKQSGQQSAVSVQPPVQPVVQGGLRAYIDPVTGQLTSPTAEQTRQAQELSWDMQNAMSTSDVGLYQEELPGGGFKVDLQGRFRSAIFATVNEAGEVSVSHSADTPSSDHTNHQHQGE